MKGRPTPRKVRLGERAAKIVRRTMVHAWPVASIVKLINHRGAECFGNHLQRVTVGARHDAEVKLRAEVSAATHRERGRLLARIR